MRNKSKSAPQPKTTLKWNRDGELSSIDMARLVNALSAIELKIILILVCVVIEEDITYLNKLFHSI
tara:strand:+ start:154 stop:351 length:198 start_codon:yes stop_codon:yes gene_type:complete